jgi:1-acyl-sn-glycerol-3-phosphate acyltransferase
MLTVLMLLFWLIATPLGALIAFPWTFITRSAGLLYWVGTRIAWWGIHIAGIRVRTHGLDALDRTGTYIFMSNHASNLDPPALMPIVPRRTSVLVKKELFRIPILGPAMRIASLVPVDRANREAAIASLAEATRVIQRGKNMTIFIEGTRSRTGKLLPFKKGPFYLAAQTKVPVVPVTIANTSVLLPKGKRVARPGIVDITFHAPIAPEQFGSTEELMSRVRSDIASSLPPELR